MRSRNKKGFTLLEIIIVVIIVAILASVALPKLTAAIAFSKAGEALKGISAIREAMDQCYAMNNNSYLTCNSLTAIGASFTPKYFGAPAFTTSATGYTISFTSLSNASSALVYNSSYNAGQGAINGTGDFIKIQQ